VSVQTLERRPTAHRPEPMPEPSRARSRCWPLALGALFCVATLYHWLQSRGHVTPAVFTDELMFSELARSVAEGEGLTVRGRDFLFPAVVPVLLQAPAWLAGGATAYGLAKVLNAVLGSGMSSRLFCALRDEAGLAYAVGSFYPTRRETSRLVLHIGTAPRNVSQAHDGMKRQLARLAEEPVPDDELERAKAAVTGAFDLDRRTNARQSFYLGFFELVGVGYAYISRYRDAIEAVTSADVQRVARRHLVDPAVVVVGPSILPSLAEAGGIPGA